MAQNKRKKQHICLYLIATKYLKNNAPVEYMDSWTWTYSLVIIYWKYQKQYLTGQSFCMWIVWVYVGVHVCVCDCAEFVSSPKHCSRLVNFETIWLQCIKIHIIQS